jgi:peptidylprolyl isomerase
MPKLILTVIAVGFASLIAFGCGGGSSSSETSSGGSEATTASEKFEIPVQGKVPTRTEKEIEAKWDGKGLLGPQPKPIVPTAPPPEELVVQELIDGKGRTARKGSEITVQYVGVNYKTGKEFDASWRYGKPFTFELGAGFVVPGWEEGLEGMEVGARRELIIPPELGYGYRRQEGIPPGSTLVFVVDLLSVE